MPPSPAAATSTDPPGPAAPAHQPGLPPPTPRLTRRPFYPHIVKMADDNSDLGAALLAAADARKARFRHQMAIRGFTAHNGAAGEALLHLDPQGMSQTALTAAMGLSKQAVQQLLDQLETGNYLRRESDPADKRAKRIILTDFGAREFAERKKVLAELEEDTRDRLGKKLLAKLEKALRKLAEP